jgi:hypothetical protein
MRLVVFLGVMLVTVQAQAALPGMEGGRSIFLDMVTREALARGVPPELADAVAMVETGYRPDARGSAGEVGLMQILPATAASLGFRGSLEDLFEPAMNIHYAVDYLSRAWAMSDGDICRTLMKYRAGLGQEIMSPLSATYCSRAISWLMGVGSLLGKGVTVPTPAAVPAVTAPDPYVVVVGAALAANAGMNQVTVTPHEMLPRFRARRSMAERNALLQTRFDSHTRHAGRQAAHGDDPDD